jgi:two-component system response regulator VanR
LSLLYVEDNKRVLNSVKPIFEKLFSKLHLAIDGIEALEIFKREHIDVIITDLDMPNLGGIELIKEIRRDNKQISIIVLTAHSDTDSLLEASNLQIDGYVIKPITLSKILTPLSNAIQRSKPETEYFLKSGLKYVLKTKTIYNQNGNVIELGNKENQLLELFLSNLNRVLTKDEIISTIWGFDEITESALKNLISNLRSKIGKDNIVNYPGQGWQISL